MSAAEPESQELEVNWERDDLGVKVTTSLGDASVTLDYAWGEGAAQAANTLAACLPQVMIQVEAAIRADLADNQEDA